MYANIFHGILLLSHKGNSIKKTSESCYIENVLCLLSWQMPYTNDKINNNLQLPQGQW